ncbi:hypothetical protein [Eikenella sp. Marseille-P7795]|uniref:hypothetical protein n=1 Tax=Eikenella sp. Marseille-P7795 TaxID=2866577 RepID=UPI001CE41767|nr:hypothetical protein [Eikenella sp. Marseille-P7795]
MKHKRPSLFLLAIGSALLLAGCEQKAETSVVAPSASEVAAASQAAAASEASPSQTITSSDGAISLVVNGHFEDKSAEAAQYIDGADSNKPILLQHDAENDITIYINNFGAPKQPADAYFAKLAESIRAGEGLENTEVDAPAEQRMAYRFSHGKDDNALNESCVAVYAKNIYNVCATSGTASLAELDTLLSQITVKE